MISWPGVHSDDTVVFCARTDIDGATITLTVTGEGSDNAVSDYATDDGVVRLEVSGLSADTLYECTLSSDEAEDDVVLAAITMPSSGGDARVIIFSCQGNGDLHTAKAMARETPHVVVLTGDAAYNEGQFITDLASSQDVESFYGLKRHAVRQNSRNWLWTKGPGFAYVVDDHDWGFNDSYDDYAEMKTKLTAHDASFASMTEGQWETFKSNAAAAIKAYSKGNPVNSDPDAEADAFYFRFPAGDFEVFVLSQVMSSPTRMRPKWGDASLNGAAQEAWLKTQLAASTKPFKLMAAPKNALQNRQANPDGWADYNDVYALLEWISNSGVTGVAWVGGDFHSPGLFAAKKGIPEGTQYSSLGLTDASGSGYDFDAISICGCPVSRYAPTNIDDTNTRCDIRNSDKNNEGPVDVALWVCTVENGRSTAALNAREYVGFTKAAGANTGKATLSYINGVSDTVFSADILAGTNTIHDEGTNMADLYIGLDPDTYTIDAEQSLLNSGAKMLVENEGINFYVPAGYKLVELGITVKTTSEPDREIGLALYNQDGSDNVTTIVAQETATVAAQLTDNPTIFRVYPTEQPVPAGYYTVAATVENTGTQHIAADSRYTGQSSALAVSKIFDDPMGTITGSQGASGLAVWAGFDLIPATGLSTSNAGALTRTSTGTHNDAVKKFTYIEG